MIAQGIEAGPRYRKCLHLYHYQIHPRFGFMSARIQTWFPFRIQICVNGREWLARGMDAAGLHYLQRDNCFTWLEHPERFALEPALTLGPGPHHTRSGIALFGALGDSAPDRWGRALMRRAERRRAGRGGRSPRTLLETDYLRLVDDEARQGALRFAEREGGPFLAPGGGPRIPPLVDRLVAAGAVDKAHECFLEAAKNPDFADAYIHLGQLALAQNRLDEAIHYLSRAVQIKPRSALAHEQMGRALWQSGQRATAVPEFRAAAEGAFVEYITLEGSYKLP